ncbi:hypothetical protein NY2A_B540R [Paramecium bursaria Chlorella virus NY2A]|uniref:Uncharacterized protein B540R n=1 Tax=Paramecium bursaria Chlorella virus NY2A TaxID=46021 RepID=A7IX65_PBCVN|nr:hypothetical protein NY2A_B540R [Paramecium bursaria Chlorella virus NY2A]ABT14939.1 hypothetical protein NY2A_B540R [Paramecium bursaria Chlorella virus NY2A]
MKQQKTIEARLKEVIEFRKKIDELGLSTNHPQVAELIEKMNDFVRGTGFSGHVDLSDFGRTAICKLSLQPHFVSTIVLRQKR